MVQIISLCEVFPKYYLFSKIPRKIFENISGQIIWRCVQGHLLDITFVLYHGTRCRFKNPLSSKNFCHVFQLTEKLALKFCPIHGPRCFFLIWWRSLLSHICHKKKSKAKILQVAKTWYTWTLASCNAIFSSQYDWTVYSCQSITIKISLYSSVPFWIRVLSPCPKHLWIPKNVKYDKFVSVARSWIHGTLKKPLARKINHPWKW